MNRLRRGRGRGQSTVELALILPFLVGLFTLALQGGQLVSDQLALSQFAADGAEWGVLNVLTQSDANLTTHLLDELCGSGGTTSAPAAGATKYCTSSLSLSVTARSTPTSLRRQAGPTVAAAPGPHPTGAALAAATGCRQWDIAVTPASGNPGTVTQNSSLQYTVTLTIHSGGGVGAVDPIVALSGNGYPNNTSPGFPIFNPPSVTTGSTTSTVSFSTTSGTTPGNYTVSIGGVDQCGDGPKAGNVNFAVTVTGPSPSPSPACTPPTILSVIPITGSGGSITGVTILGTGFGSGSTVTFGGVAASAVTIVSATQISATIPGLSPGVYTTTVSAPSQQCSVSSSNSLTICSGPCPTPSLGGSGGSGSQNPCASQPVPNHYQTVIRISWPEPLFIPWFSPAVTLTATTYLYCQ